MIFIQYKVLSIKQLDGSVNSSGQVSVRPTGNGSFAPECHIGGGGSGGRQAPLTASKSDLSREFRCFHYLQREYEFVSPDSYLSY